MDDYEVFKNIGKGKYSEVFRGFNTVNHEPVVAKMLKPVRKAKIKREVLILNHVSGGPHIIKFLDFLMEPVSKTPSIVHPFNLSLFLDSGGCW